MEKNKEVAEETLEEQNVRREKELMGEETKQQDREDSQTMTDISEALSVRDRLIARTRSKTVKIEFEHIDEEGKLIDTIIVECRMLTGLERARVALLFSKLTEFAADDAAPSEDELTREESMKRFTVLNDVMKEFTEIAAQIVVTPGLSDYFMSGQASDGDITKIITDALLGSIENTGDSIKRFREE